MPNKKYKICACPGCNEITRDKYCDKHKKTDTYLKKRNMMYNRYRKENNPKEYYFYKSKEWLDIRYLAITRDLGLCQECLKHNIKTRGTEVHHKMPIKEDWSKRYELENLVTLCRSCHNKIEKKHPQPQKPL